jgi:Protein of unknown function (DUF2846)
MGIEALLARRIFIGGVLLLALTGCAGGLSPASSSGSAKALPPLDPAKGRVFIYRTSVYGASYTPDVLLNGEWVGKPDKRGVFFRDVLPGSYAVATSTTSKVANFSVGAGERKYVRLTSGFFEGRMLPELVDPAKGEAEVSGLEVLVQTRKMK